MKGFSDCIFSGFKVQSLRVYGSLWHWNWRPMLWTFLRQHLAWTWLDHCAYATCAEIPTPKVTKPILYQSYVPSTDYLTKPNRFNPLTSVVWYTLIVPGAASHRTTFRGLHVFVNREVPLRRRSCARIGKTSIHFIGHCLIIVWSNWMQTQDLAELENWFAAC